MLLVRSNGVPTIDLVDMPGIVATRADKQNPELSRLTEQCTSEYLAKESTGCRVNLFGQVHPDPRGTLATNDPVP